MADARVRIRDMRRLVAMTANVLDFPDEVRAGEQAAFVSPALAQLERAVGNEAGGPPGHTDAG
jgi:pheromone shutdown protein TraB